MSILDDIKNANLDAEDVLQVAKSASKAADAALAGKPFEAISHALDAVFAVVTNDEDMKAHLTDAAVRRQKRIKAIADEATFDENGNRRQ